MKLFILIFLLQITPHTRQHLDAMLRDCIEDQKRDSEYIERLKQARDVQRGTYENYCQRLTEEINAIIRSGRLPVEVKEDDMSTLDVLEERSR